MRSLLLIGIAAATLLSGSAEARGRHHGDRHERHHFDRHRDRHHGDRHRRVTVGYRLSPLYYGPRYYVSDYPRYRVRAPGRHLRWIRYGYDLLLVDIRSGRVVEVLPGRFVY